MIPAYPRDNPTESHADFGEPCAAPHLCDSLTPASFGRIITAHKGLDLPEAASYRPDLDTGPVDHFLRACRVELIDGVTSMFEATVFPPEGAVYASGDGAGHLIGESLFHSQIWYSDWFRNDKSTGWQWRCDRGWHPSIRVPTPVIFCYHAFHFQYFHWLIDCLPHVWLAKARDAVPAASKWAIGPLNTPMHVASIRLFDIRPEDCVWFDRPVVQFDQAVYSGFHFREPLRTRPSYHNGVHQRGWWPDYLKELRDRAVFRHGDPLASRNLKLYITRDDALHRKIVNACAVDALFDEFGFTRVTPGTLAFEQQVAIFSRARVVVGTHGAGLTNAIWCAPGARLLEFMPAPLGDPGYRFLCQLCGHDYSCLFVKCLEHPRGIAYADIEVDVERLRLALVQIAA